MTTPIAAPADASARDLLKQAKATIAVLMDRATTAEAERDALRAEIEGRKEDAKKLVDLMCDKALELGEAKVRIKELEEALRPFAYVAQSFPFQPGTNELRERRKADAIVWNYQDGETDYRLYASDLRRARSALGAQDASREGRDGREQSDGK